MKIKFWGARGSIPVCGKKYLKYGGSTTCLELRSQKNELIVIDAGSGIRLLGKELLKNPHNDFNMLFTHSHWDHVMGFPFFAPIYSKKTKIRIRGCSFSPDSVREIIAKTMQPPGFPVKFEEISAKFEFDSVCAAGFDIGHVRIVPVELSHPNRGLGYKFLEDGRSFVFLTDNELGFIHPDGRSPRDYAAFCHGADLLVHDADYNDSEYPRRKTWGHSTYRQAVDLALEAGVSVLGLFHHNQDRSDAEVDAAVAECSGIFRGRGSKTKCVAIKEGQVIEL
ncbi:MAG: metal-dependent hydrolase [Elusimicrobia bacterium GWC2_51_8]|nr:MAG: metal-dependent hydrolase [Elusimicrobia bacterium GWA2_51_34]OGR64836.1 MAG: metal-dependent hydrolase [Elusimicrobia bacterium GWC2_51_8]OGR88108.1 MAG: metal-dependent hydrolase [Elusimicrobia bacterium GWF2_52_66]HAF96653.1 MBL fold metallo-hydrolase [Elusimicrobiota bacterium]HCE98478.1 MBL fold metallo-hydrolase [Elusimicrobiota bacterium]